LTPEQHDHARMIFDGLARQNWNPSIDTVPPSTQSVLVDAAPAPPVFRTPHHAAEWYTTRGRKVPKLGRFALE
jgi:hypothetical protein